MTSQTTRDRFGGALLTIGLAAVVVAACSSPTGAAPSQPAEPVPTQVPATPAPSAEPTVRPSAAPSQDGEDAMPITVQLQTANGADVVIDIVDRAGILAGAVSGQPGEGVSVPGETVLVENIDARTLRLTWMDFPMDNRLALYIDPAADGYQLLLIQPGPTGPTDAIGMDRELELTFERDVPAALVQAFLQEGLDTPG